MILPRRFLPGGLPQGIPPWPPDVSLYTYEHTYQIAGSAGNWGLDVDYDDGSALYYSRGSSAGITECQMPTGFDISSISGCLTNTNITATGLLSIRMRPDNGGHLFIAQDTGLTVNIRRYTTVTPYSLTGITEASVIVKDITSILTSGNITGLFIKFDGLRLWTTDGAANTYEFSMSPAWDLSSLSLVNTFASMPAANGLYFDPTGMQYYTTISKRIDQWDLTAAFDLSTIPGTPTHTLDLTTEAGAGTVFGLAFKPNGDKLYALTWPNRRIHQFAA